MTTSQRNMDSLERDMGGNYALPNKAEIVLLSPIVITELLSLKMRCISPENLRNRIFNIAALESTVPVL